MNDRDETPAPGMPRAYEPPRLSRVHLVPDEAVLASCKNSVTAGPTGLAGKCVGSPSTCFNNAS
jgi:hypothetical protein